MATDVLERLQTGIPDGEGVGYAVVLMLEAAFEIERLRGLIQIPPPKGTFYCHPDDLPYWAGLQTQHTDALRYATRLATQLCEMHWKIGAPDWEPLPDLLGLLTQIDNMTAGLQRAVTSS